MLQRVALIALLISLGATAPGTTLAAERPNFVVILADDLGFSDLGCYGGEIETPNLDALAAGGLRFTQFYNTARCWPSRAALLTGHYAQAVRRDTVPPEKLPGVPTGSAGIRPTWAKLLPELLEPAGYRSYHSGKWHVDGQPLENGFARSYEIGGGGQNNYFRVASVTDDERPVQQTDDYYVTTAIADHAVRCLQEHAAEHSDRPFFHYICFTAPHFPLHAPADDIARYRDRYLAGWESLREERYARLKDLGIADHPLPPLERDVGPPYHFPEALKKLGDGEVNRPHPWDKLTEEQRRFQATKMAIHAAMVDRMDREIGRVVEKLKAMNALENTLILFASDNGASAEIMVRGDGHDTNAPPGSAATYLCLGPGFSSASNTPFRRHKTWVHEGGITTPLVAHWPRGIEARGELRRAPGHLIDIAPTLLELAGLESSRENAPRMEGRSLVGTFGRDAAPHEILWWQHEGNRALRHGDWKIVAAGRDAPWELYNLATDRGETNNLAEAEPQRVRELAARWEEEAARLYRLAAEK